MAIIVWTWLQLCGHICNCVEMTTIMWTWLQLRGHDHNYVDMTTIGWTWLQLCGHDYTMWTWLQLCNFDASHSPYRPTAAKLDHRQWRSVAWRRFVARRLIVREVCLFVGLGFTHNPPIRPNPSRLETKKKKKEKRRRKKKTLVELHESCSELLE